MSKTPRRERLKVWVRGAVQGVGFRPFVFRLATELDLAGWVLNSASGVVIEVEGPAGRLQEFLLRLERERPPRAVVQGAESWRLDAVGYAGFEIRASVDGDKSALVLPDIATCPDCLADVRDPGNRRYRYPFTNCTNCGPRFSIILALPYDRPRTTMGAFEMCEACRAEYQDPRNRRFHAQPNACPTCGPKVELWDRAGGVRGDRDEALREAVECIRGGMVVAVKGLGGFHLVCDAGNAAAVRRLREGKAREEKPFALMFPSIEAVCAECRVSDLEARLLSSPEAPIVLLERRRAAGEAAAGAVCEDVAPGNPSLGAMLPYTPLHHLLLADLGRPIVATSGNLADEPICTDERDAVARLGGLADAFLVHDRPIARHVDDSIVRVVLDRELLLRRARGYAPLPIAVPGVAERGPVLGVGPHLKNTVALSVGANVFVSQHIGDLETVEAYRAFEQVTGALQGLYEARPALVACDAHPNYLSTGFARRVAAPRVEVQHHVAHVVACMAENEIEAPALGVAWDGTGYGHDGSIWGGEFFLVRPGAVTRVAALRSFPLPGGDQAVREPRRSAFGLLYELARGRQTWGATSPGGEEQVWGEAPASPLLDIEPRERALLARMIDRGINAPRTSSMGRLFDAVAALAGIRQRCRYEGQAAMELEYAALAGATDRAYPIAIREQGKDDEPRWVLDWAPLVDALLEDVREGCPIGSVAARFHEGLVAAAIEIARRVGEPRVVLSGGCFQNRWLTERLVARLRAEGFAPYWHQRVPPNDGGIALGQVAAAAQGLGRKIDVTQQGERDYVPGRSGEDRQRER